MDESSAVRAYLPRAVLDHPDDAPRHLRVEGTLLFSDVSGFTRMSERLARYGRAGAEEMVGAVSTVFTPLVGVLDGLGGDVLKFSGDALVSLFSGPDHAVRAAAAAAGLRRALGVVGSVRTAGGTVRLRMSQGMTSGVFHVVHAGTGAYRDVVVVGPDATTTFALESAASAGEVLVGPGALERLPAAAVTARADGAPMLRPSYSFGDLTSADYVVQAIRATTHPLPQHALDYVPLGLRDRLADAVHESEHRTVTVSFAQFRGTDALVAAGDEAALVERLDALVDATTELAERYAVTVICVDAGPDGGKLMLTAGAPDTDERHSESMLRMTHDLVALRPGFDLHVGVNRGNVYAGIVGAPTRFTYSTMGDAVNLAARLSGRAAAGTILATERTLAHAGDGVRTVAVPRFMVKGKTAPIEAGLLEGWADETAPPPEPAAPDRTFVGRGPELAALEGAAADAAAGAGRLVEIVGEAGVGKSRLVAELRRRAPGMQTLRVRCQRQDRRRPHAVSRTIVRALAGIDAGAAPAPAGEALLAFLAARAPHLLPMSPLLAAAAHADVPPTPEVDALAAEFRAARLQDAVEALALAAATDPVLLVLEDVDWMDDSSRGVVEATLRRVHTRPWLVVATRRAVDAPLRAGGEPLVLELAALPPDQAVELAAAQAAQRIPRAVMDRLVARSQGNPLFLTELVAAWSPEQGEGDLPESVEAILAQRIERLPVAPRRLLRYAAVLGERVDPELLAAALADPEPGTPMVEAATWVHDRSAWEALDELLVPTGDGGREFRHSLVRQAAYEALPFARRRQLHRRIGLVLEARGSNLYAVMAYHFDHARDHDRAWRYGVAAAERARAAYAPAEAADLYALAVRAGTAGGVTPEEIAGAAELMGDSADLAGRLGTAEEAYAVARRGCARERAWHVLGKSGRLAARRGSYRTALSFYGRALRAAQDLPRQEAAVARMTLHAYRGGVRLYQGRYPECIRECRLVVDDPEADLDPPSVARAAFVLDSALSDLGRFDEAKVWREVALPVFRRIGDLVGEADVLNNLGIDAYYEGRLDDALAYYGQSLRARERAGDVVHAATARNNLAEVLSDLGRLDEAEAQFEEALAVWEHAGFRIGVALATSNLGRLRTRQGRPEEALPLLTDALARFHDLRADANAVEVEVRIAEALLAAGRAGEALARCDELLGEGSRAAASVAAVASEAEAVRAAARRTLDATTRSGAVPAGVAPR